MEQGIKRGQKHAPEMPDENPYSPKTTYASQSNHAPCPLLCPIDSVFAGEANTLFRSNSLASKSMESFLKVRYLVPGLFFFF